MFHLAQIVVSLAQITLRVNQSYGLSYTKTLPFAAIIFS